MNYNFLHSSTLFASSSPSPIKNYNSFTCYSSKRAFSSSSPFLSYNLSNNSKPELLTINSSYNKINFINGKSILFLPSICLIDNSLSNYTKDEYGRITITNDMRMVIDQDSLFFERLFTILKYLWDYFCLGDYTLDFYFYVEGKLFSDIVEDVYTSNGVDNKCLIKTDLCSYGYKKLLGSQVELRGYNITLETAHLMCFLGSGLTDYESSDKFNFNIMHRDINKEVLLVITSKKGDSHRRRQDIDSHRKVGISSSFDVALGIPTTAALRRAGGLSASNLVMKGARLRRSPHALKFLQSKRAFSSPTFYKSAQFHPSYVAKIYIRSFSSSLPSLGALKNLMIIDNYVEYDQDGYEIEYPIDYSEREYYVARYELVK